MIFKTEDDMTQACSLLGLNDVWMGRAVSGRDDLKQTDKSYFVTIWEKSVVSGPRASTDICMSFWMRRVGVGLGAGNRMIFIIFTFSH